MAKKKVVVVDWMAERKADALLKELGYRPDGRPVSELPQEQLEIEAIIKARMVSMSEVGGMRVLAVVC